MFWNTLQITHPTPQILVVTKKRWPQIIATAFKLPFLLILIIPLYIFLSQEGLTSSSLHKLATVIMNFLKGIIRTLREEPISFGPFVFIQLAFVYSMVSLFWKILSDIVRALSHIAFGYELVFNKMTNSLTINNKRIASLNDIAEVKMREISFSNRGQGQVNHIHQLKLMMRERKDILVYESSNVKEMRKVAERIADISSSTVSVQKRTNLLSYLFEKLKSR